MTRSITTFFALTISLAGILATPAASGERTLRLVAVGDSLTAGYGLPAKDSFPAQLEALLRQRGLNVQLINAGVSGDTTSAGLARFDWSVPDDTDGVILELGANDALRGLDPAAAENALDIMLSRLKERRIPVLLAGMYAPRNLGPEYVTAFDAIYPRLAEKYGTVFYPFFLEGMMGIPSLGLGDGLHPNAEGVGVIARGILPKVEELIARIRQR